MKKPMRYVQCYHCHEWGRYDVVGEMKVRNWMCDILKCCYCGKRFLKVKDKNDV